MYEGIHRCFQCGEEFKTREDMHSHRKTFHRDVKPCEKFFLTRNCRFQDKCWFSHENEIIMKSPETPKNQVFQKPLQKPFPPLRESPTLAQIVAKNTPSTMQPMQVSSHTILVMLKTMEENMNMLRFLLARNQ